MRNPANPLVRLELRTPNLPRVGNGIEGAVGSALWQPKRRQRPKPA